VTALRHNNLRDLLGAYALGAVDASEAAAMREHLATCAECQAELAELWAAVETLPATIEPMEPPPMLRERIAAAVLAEPRPASPREQVQTPTPATPPDAPVTRPPEPIRRPTRWTMATPWAAAAAALLLVALGMFLWNLQLRGQLTATTPETITLAPTDAAPDASGEVRYDPADNLLVLDVQNLPPLAAGEVYEVWLIGADGVPAPAGTFDQATDRHAIVADRAQFETLAITNEPGPLGTEAPTGEILATAPL
jgi:anti-sigma-K factor RskA